MNKNMFLPFICLLQLTCSGMDNQPPQYTLPAATPNSPIGGLIDVPQTIDNFIAGQRIAPLYALQIPPTSSPNLVQARFTDLYETLLEQLGLNHPRVQLYKQSGIALRLLDEEGNFIQYANPLPAPQLHAIEVEQEIDNHAALEQDRQNEQDAERTWLDHWLTPVLVRRVVMWWKEE